MGVQKRVTREGDGSTFPKQGDKLAMHYTGRLADGTKFDSSVDRGQPFEFSIGVGQVIRGWDDGVIQMSLGEAAVLEISPDFGYGAAGAGGVIPPNAALTFEVELLAIGDNVAPPPAPVDPLAPVPDDPSLSRVLLVGDSISIGYHVDVRTRLAGVANVHRPDTNGGHTGKGVAMLADWLQAHGPRPWDVIHFNWGLHDLRMGGQDASNGASPDPKSHQIAVDKYSENLRAILDILAAKAPTAKLIWCATTPVPSPRTAHQDGSTMRHASDVSLYNAAAAEVTSARGIPCNDLYEFALPILGEIQLPENVHFTEAGSSALGGAVAPVR